MILWTLVAPLSALGLILLLQVFEDWALREVPMRHPDRVRPRLREEAARPGKGIGEGDGTLGRGVGLLHGIRHGGGIA